MWKSSAWPTTLRQLGMDVRADEEIWRRVWTREERVNNASTPMFLVRAVKPECRAAAQ